MWTQAYVHHFVFLNFKMPALMSNLKFKFTLEIWFIPLLLWKFSNEFGNGGLITLGGWCTSPFKSCFCFMVPFKKNLGLSSNMKDEWYNLWMQYIEGIIRAPICEHLDMLSLVTSEMVGHLLFLFRKVGKWAQELTIQKDSQLGLHPFWDAFIHQDMISHNNIHQHFPGV